MKKLVFLLLAVMMVVSVTSASADSISAWAYSATPGVLNADTDSYSFSPFDDDVSCSLTNSLDDTTNGEVVSEVYGTGAGTIPQNGPGSNSGTLYDCSAVRVYARATAGSYGTADAYARASW